LATDDVFAISISVLVLFKLFFSSNCLEF